MNPNEPAETDYEELLLDSKEVRSRLTRLMANVEAAGLDEVAEDAAKARAFADKVVKELRALHEEAIKKRHAGE